MVNSFFKPFVGREYEKGICGEANISSWSQFLLQSRARERCALQVLRGVY